MEQSSATDDDNVTRQTSGDLPLRNRLPIIALLAANGISYIGNSITLIAIPWFVLQTTGSATKTGISGAVTVLPVVIAGILGGALVDRIGFKRTSVISDLASGITVALIPLLHQTVGLAFWQLLLLVFLGALLDAPGNTGRQSLIPDLAEMAGWRLEQVNSVAQAMSRGAQFVGPLIAGAMIAAVGASNVLWIDAATFAVSALLVATAIPAVKRHEPATERSSYLADLASGFRFVLQDRLVLTMLVVITVTNFLSSPLFTVVLPVYTNEVYGSAVNLGLMLASFGGGALLGSLLYAALGHFLPRRATLIGSFVIAGVPFGVLALFPGLLIACAALFGSGLASGPINPLLMTIFQERTPADMRGRIFGMIQALAWLTMPLGMLAAGLALEQFGLRVTIAGVAIGFVGTTLTLLVNPSLHELRLVRVNKVQAATTRRHVRDD